MLAMHERVEILCHDADVRAACESHLRAHGVTTNVRTHLVATDRVWLRDSAPTFVHDERGRVQSRRTGRSTHGRSTPTCARRGRRPRSPSITGCRGWSPPVPMTGERLVLEGGGIEVNGDGTDARDRGMAALRRAGAQPRSDAARTTSRVPRLARHPRDDLARRGMRRRRHARPHRRHRALRRARHVVSPSRSDPADDNHARSMDNLRRLELAARLAAARWSRDAPVSAAGDDEWRAAAGELRELLHRQRRRARADVQRPQRSRRAQHDRRADAGPRRRRHPRRRSGLGPRHPALPDAAGTCAAVGLRRLPPAFGISRRERLHTFVAIRRRSYSDGLESSPPSYEVTR